MAGKYIDSASNLFDTMDKTGNGSLHRIEFLEGLRSLNLALTETQINDMFDSIDKDTDNAIEKIEFVKLIEGPPETTDVPPIRSPETSPSSTQKFEDSEVEFWNKMKTVISHTPSMMHEKISIESAKKVYSVSKLVQKRTIGSDKSVIEGLLSRVVLNDDIDDLGGVNDALVRKYIQVLAAVSRHRLDSHQSKLSAEEIRSLKMSAKKHLKHFESKKKVKKKKKTQVIKKHDAVHTASSMFLPSSSSCSQEEDYLQAFMDSSDNNVNVTLIENIVRSREKTRIEEETRARQEKKSMEEDSTRKKAKKEKSQAVVFETVVEKASNHVQDDENNYIGYTPPKPSSRKEFKEEFEEWMRSLGGGLDKFISQYTYELGARSLQDIADFMSDESSIRKTMTMLNEKQIGIFVKAAQSLKDKLRGSSRTCELYISVFHRLTLAHQINKTHRYVRNRRKTNGFDG